VRVPGIFGIQVRVGQFGVTDDRHEQVIEIVSNSSGERADGFQFLGETELRFQFGAFNFGPLAVGNVAEVPDTPIISLPIR